MLVETLNVLQPRAILQLRCEPLVKAAVTFASLFVGQTLFSECITFTYKPWSLSGVAIKNYVIGLLQMYLAPPIHLRLVAQYGAKICYDRINLT